MLFVGVAICNLKKLHALLETYVRNNDLVRIIPFMNLIRTYDFLILRSFFVPSRNLYNADKPAETMLQC